MNYNKLYDRIINRAIHRNLPKDFYVEKHHIVPRCQGGTDDASNIVALTAKEHYIAHICLAKIHPNHYGLTQAAMMMSVCASNNQRRITGKVYQWLREQHANAMKHYSTGANNSQYGKCWVVNKATREERKILKSELLTYSSNGWEQGRTTSITRMRECVLCGKPFIFVRAKTCSKECSNQLKYKNKVFFGREQEFYKLYDELGSMNKALKAMGFKGAVSHYYEWASTLVKERQQMDINR